jgi:hypothetical protein
MFFCEPITRVKKQKNRWRKTVSMLRYSFLFLLVLFYCIYKKIRVFVHLYSLNPLPQHRRAGFRFSFYTHLFDTILHQHNSQGIQNVYSLYTYIPLCFRFSCFHFVFLHLSNHFFTLEHHVFGLGNKDLNGKSGIICNCNGRFTCLSIVIDFISPSR